MKKQSLIFVLSLFLLGGCAYSSEGGSTSTDISGSNSTSNPTTDSSSSSSSKPINDYIEPIESIQDTTILHAWDWRLNDIKSYLPKIDKYGYKTIQISPMQPHLDKLKWKDESTASQWFKLYQPLDFEVANNDDNLLGNRSDLVSLCSEAKKYDIDIVVDIVSNHLAGGGGQYNDQVYTKYPLHPYIGNTDDGSIQKTVQGCVGGLPDVDTSNTEVQNKIISMLKDYIDCGITGFRFDTAKHLETPDDGEWASNYWPNVLGSVTSYAKTKNVDPYYYGEILYTCGTGRSYSSYTKYMSVTDNRMGSDVLNAIKASTTNNLIKDYPTGVEADKLMLWAESHDTYANTPTETGGVSQEVINRAFAIQNTRKDASSLYFTRPQKMGVKMCEIYENGWINAEIIGSNYFHRIYNKKAENRFIENNCYINVRGEGKYAGAAIISPSGASSVTFDLKGVANQSYIDLASGKTYVYKGSETISLTNGCAFLVPEELTKGFDIDFGPTEGYNSSIVIQNANANKTYFCWNWTNNYDGSLLMFSQDNDAIGVTISANKNYLIAECDEGTTVSSFDWSKVNRQTNDLYYNGSQVIHSYSSLPWK